MEVLRMFDSTTKTEVIYNRSWKNQIVIEQVSTNLVTPRDIYLTEEEAIELSNFLLDVLHVRMNKKYIELCRFLGEVLQ